MVIIKGDRVCLRLTTGKHSISRLLIEGIGGVVIGFLDSTGVEGNISAHIGTSVKGHRSQPQVQVIANIEERACVQLRVRPVPEDDICYLVWVYNPPTYKQCEFFGLLQKAVKTDSPVETTANAQLRKALAAIVKELRSPVDQFDMPLVNTALRALRNYSKPGDRRKALAELARLGLVITIPGRPGRPTQYQLTEDGVGLVLPSAAGEDTIPEVPQFPLGQEMQQPSDEEPHLPGENLLDLQGEYTAPTEPIGETAPTEGYDPEEERILAAGIVYEKLTEKLAALKANLTLVKASIRKEYACGRKQYRKVLRLAEVGLEKQTLDLQLEIEAAKTIAEAADLI